MTTQIGFNAKNEQEETNAKKPIDEILKNIVSQEKDPYSVYRGRYLQVDGHAVSINGVYRGMRDVAGVTELVFCPFVLNQTAEIPLREDVDRRVHYYEMSSGNEAAFLNLHEVVLVIPREESYIISRIDATKRIAGIEGIEKDLDLRF